MRFIFCLSPDAETGITTIEEPTYSAEQIVDGSVISGELVGQAVTIPDRVQAAATEFNGAEGSASFVVVTYDRKDVNRHGNRVNIMPNKYGQGLMDDDWKKNPVVFFDHGFGESKPIGIGSPLKKSATTAKSTVKFHGKTAASTEIMALVDAGVLKMASIGFDPRKGVRIEMPQSKKEEDPVKAELLMRQWGWEILEAELQEWSVVGIGADRGALRQAFERGHQNGEKFTEPMMRWLQWNMVMSQALGVGWEAPSKQQLESTVVTPQRVEIIVVHQNAPAPAGAQAQQVIDVTPAAPVPAPAPAGVAPGMQQMIDAIASAVKAGVQPIVQAQETNAREIAKVTDLVNQRLGIIPTN